MNNRWLPGVLASLILGALPSSGHAQIYGPGTRYGNAYSPYWYARHGSYYEPSYYDTSPSSFGSSLAGTATAVYGNSYSPYWYARHGSYAEPHYYDSYPTYPAIRYVQPSAISYAQPVYSPSYALRPGSSSAGEEQEEALNASKLATIEVRVPANAELWFEGDKTSQNGAVRNFISPELAPGKTFTYDVRARWTDSSGTVVERTKQLKVHAGRRSMVEFSASDIAPKK